MTTSDDADVEERHARVFDIAELARRAEPREVTSATFSYVDALLTGRLTSTDLDRLRAEILEPADTNLPPAEEVDPDRAALEAIEQRIGAGDYSNALAAADEILARRPGHEAASRFRSQCTVVLANTYQHHLGPGESVPRLSMSLEALAGVGLDRWAAYVLSRIDGVGTIDDLVDLTGFSRLDTLRVLYDLVVRGVVSIHEREPPAATQLAANATPAPVAVARIRLRRREP